MVSLREDNRGVSVVVGALMLILIVMTAASTLALFVSEAQKEEMDRRSYMTSVETEELTISYIDLTSNSTSWSSMNITILNLNVEDAYVTGISVNEMYASNYTSDGERYNLANRLLIPAAGSKEVHLNLTSDFAAPFNISEEEPVTIRLITSLTNNFELTFKPPVANVKTGIELEDLGVADRAVLVLDGSDSFDDGSIMNWNWTIWDSCNNESTHHGKITRVVFNTSGPFKVRLTVTDDTGMEGTSENITIPENPNFNPPTNLNASYSAPTITAHVKDIEGGVVEGIAVNFLVLYDGYGNLTLDPWSNITAGTGMVTTTVVNGTGTIRVLSGKLAPVDVSIS